VLGIPYLTGVSILPVFPMPRAPAERNVQNEQESTQNGAKCHRDIEWREVAVLVLLEVRILQVLVTLV